MIRFDTNSIPAWQNQNYNILDRLERCVGGDINDPESRGNRLCLL
jgi:hypothetical protein